MQNIAKVAVEISLDREFDYLVPDELVSVVRVGARVLVPFGNRVTRGYVIGLADRSEIKNLKAIAALVGGKPLLGDNILKLARWISDYYASAFEQAIRSLLPCAVRRPQAKFLQQKTVTVVPGKIRDLDLVKLRARAPKQAAALELLLPDKQVLLTDLLERSGAGPGAVKSLEQKGVLKIASRDLRRDPFAGQTILPTQPLNLFPEQAAALDLVEKSIDTFSPPVVLLHGVTGSGKTEVYLQAIGHVLERGKGAIVLVPEIALTPQTVERFCGRFGDKVAVLHSHLSDGERHDEWHRINDGQARIVVGARSALFAPVERLGLIVVDEEHETSYKQGEAPRYNARDVAIKRGEIERCPVLLGSATPALESFYNARIGKYAIAHLHHRVDRQKMPRMNIIDMRLEAEREGRVNVFSRPLVEAIRERLERREQTMLFLNRRGFATSVICPACGFVAICAQCSVALTYHRAGEELRCHICGRAEKVPDKCAKCGAFALKFSGIGTQRIESIVHSLFPKARAQRMDADTTTAKHSHRNILGDFKTGKIDILIGTQMIAKGLHFPNVTLVGVIYADHSLHMPDFRAAERTFQLLLQVSGRAGRGDIAGEVIVQTFTPFHPAVQAARRMDYEGFCDQEVESRRELFYPPFAHLTCITLEGAPDEMIALAAKQLAGGLKPLVKPPAVLSGPMPAPISMARGQYRLQIIIRAPSAAEVSGQIKQVLRGLKCPPQVRIAVDVDALSMM
ncbi:MAG: primosomal protein N' [Kiritimatiellae bacterium]|nr:primosomal protein N' [Kiritimatiellia bacterium]